jgi:hypothetical protein
LVLLMIHPPEGLSSIIMNMVTNTNTDNEYFCARMSS